MDAQVNISLAQVIMAAGGLLVTSLLGLATHYVGKMSANVEKLVEKVATQDTRIAVLEDWRERCERHGNEPK